MRQWPDIDIAGYRHCLPPARWKRSSPSGRSQTLFTKRSDVAAALPYRHVPHPTSPESAGGTPQQIEAATTAMLTNWNSALQSLLQAVHNPDAVRPFVPYGANFQPQELVAIPPFDV